MLLPLLLSMQNESKPKKTRKKKVSPPTTTPVQNNEQPLTAEESRKVDDLKELAYQTIAESFLNRMEPNQTTHVKVAEAVQEFLSNFMILGYDYNNKPVVVLYNKTPKDNDALSTLLQKFLMVKGGAISAGDEQQ
jgi:hypothetical protein